MAAPGWGAVGMALIVLGLAWLSGIYLGSILGPPLAVSVATLSAAGMMAFWRRSSSLLLLAIAFAVLVAGMARSQAANASALPILPRANPGEPIYLRGMVSDGPMPRGNGVELRLTVDTSSFNPEQGWEHAEGIVLLQLSRIPERRYGDYLMIRGALEDVDTLSDLGYADYLRRQGIGAIVRYPSVTLLKENQGWLPAQLAYDLRTRLTDALEQSLPEPEAGLAKGILLGQRGLMSRDLSDAFVRTNTSHIIAISGQNISLLTGVLLFALRRLLPRLPATIATVAGIAAYAAFVGASPSVSRAAIMGIVFAVGDFLGRPRDTTAGLVLAGAAMTAIEPRSILDLGFQLSFLATAGLIFLAKPIQARFEALPDWLAVLLGVTIAAAAAALPLIVLTFGQLSLVGLMANLIVPPMLPLVMASSGATALATLVWGPIGQMTGYVAWLFLAIMVSAVEALSALPAAALPVGQVGVGFVIVYYAILTTLLLRLLAPTTPLHLAWRGFLARLPALPTLAALCVAVALVWAAALSFPDDDVHILVLDVGQGDAIFIRTPDHKILVDGGPNPDTLANALGRRLPFWDRVIDLVVLTHPNEDHVAGLSGVLERYEVRQALTTEGRPKTTSYLDFERLLAKRGVERRVATVGQEIDLGNGTTLRVLHPPRGATGEDNDDSIVLHLVSGNFGVLLTGDLGWAGREQLLGSGEEIKATVLKVPHHGSDDALSEDLLREVQPEVAIISAGRGNRFGHPTAQTLELLERFGAAVYRTDLNGTTEVVMRSNEYFVKTQR